MRIWGEIFRLPPKKVMTLTLIFVNLSLEKADDCSDDDLDLPCLVEKFVPGDGLASAHT